MTWGVVSVMAAWEVACRMGPFQMIWMSKTLTQEYGIARNTARHALAVLAEDALIEITPG